MKQLPDVIYLHGLGSSPGSDKARLILEHVGSLGYRAEAPVLSVPSLDKLSVDRAIEEAIRCFNRQTTSKGVVLIGSSFGGFIGLHAVARLAPQARAAVKRMVLLAPVLYPWHPNAGIITPQVEEQWTRNGVFPVEESHTGSLVNVHVEFLHELRGYNSDDVPLTIPTLIIHGEHDEVVPVKQSEEFSSKRTEVTLVKVSDGHQLLARPHELLGHIERFMREI